MISKNNLQSHFTHHTKIFSPLHLWSDTHSCQKLQYNAKNPGWITGIFTSFERDSNPRPTHYECVALPTEPSKHAWDIILDFCLCCKTFFSFFSQICTKFQLWNNFYYSSMPNTCKSDIHNPLSLLAHERSRFATCVQMVFIFRIFFRLHLLFFLNCDMLSK